MVHAWSDSLLKSRDFTLSRTEWKYRKENKSDIIWNLDSKFIFSCSYCKYKEVESPLVPTRLIIHTHTRLRQSRTVIMSINCCENMIQISVFHIIALPILMKPIKATNCPHLSYSPNLDFNHHILKNRECAGHYGVVTPPDIRLIYARQNSYLAHLTYRQGI